MAHRSQLSALVVVLASAAALSGCLTPQIKPPVSQAIVQARAAVGAKPAACAPGGLDEISPLDLGFGFDEATVTEADQPRLAAAAKWLGCNPGVPVVVIPSADSHGSAAHLTDLAQRRAQAVVAQLRADGATDAVIRSLARRAPDSMTTPHLVINARGRGW